MPSGQLWPVFYAWEKNPTQAGLTSGLGDKALDKAWWLCNPSAWEAKIEGL